MAENQNSTPTINSDDAATHPDAAKSDYTPVFSDAVRTAVYIIALVAGIVGAGFTAFGDPSVGAFISTAAAAIAGAFGTVYNPIRLSTK